MIFLDTSAIYALADRDDDNYQEALRLFTTAIANGERFICHNYILVESTALLQRRLGYQIALQFLHDAKSFTIIWVDEDLHEAARQRLENLQSAQISLVDAMSFQVMDEQCIAYYLGFDQHFSKAGYTLFTGTN